MARAARPIRFTCFPLLPGEIQDMIWSHSLTPQMIRLRREMYNFAPQHAPPFMFLLGGDEPYIHFTMETIPRPTSPYFTAHFEPLNVENPSALAVSRASRRFALSKGYKAWKMERGDGKVRDVMWNPSIDMMLFVDACSGHCFELFSEQFSAQVKEVERMALPHSFWHGNQTIGISSFTKTRLGRPLMNFTALKQLFVFVEREFWEDWTVNREGMDNPSWQFPNNIRRDLYDARKEYQEQYPELCSHLYIEAPRVSVTCNFDMALRGEDVELQ